MVKLEDLTVGFGHALTQEYLLNNTFSILKKYYCQTIIFAWLNGIVRNHGINNNNEYYRTQKL